MPQTTGTGAKKILDTDDWRDILDLHNDTVDAYDGKIGTTALPTTAQTLTGAISEHNQAIATKADKANFTSTSYNYRTYANWQAAFTAEKANLFPSDGTYCFTIITSGGSPHVFTMIKNGTFLSGVHQSYTGYTETIYSTDGGSTWVVRSIASDIVVEQKTSSAFDVGDGATGNVSIAIAKTGYTPIGCVGINGTGSSGLAYSDWYIDGNNLRIYYQNNRGQAKTGVVLKVSMLYIKN